LFHFAAGVCLCVDAEVSTGSMSANVKVVASTGVEINGPQAQAIRDAVSLDVLDFFFSLMLMIRSFGRNTGSVSLTPTLSSRPHQTSVSSSTYLSDTRSTISPTHLQSVDAAHDVSLPLALP
jgi:hypothetical protein